MILAIYLTAASLFGLALMGIDKHRARTRRWRIPEKTLFLTAALGGSPGVWAGMYLFRHKTKHKAFTFSAVAASVCQLALMVLATCRLLA